MSHQLQVLVMKILPKIIKEGPNVKIIAALSWGLFEKQDAKYKQNLINEDEWLNCMVITNTSIRNMGHWIQHPLVSEYSISADWDDKWRHGGTLEEVIEEAHLSSDWQIKGIERFAYDRKKRIKVLKRNIPLELLEKMEIK